MEKPKCRVCGARHYGNEDHRFPEDVVAGVPESPEVSASGSLQEGVGDQSRPDGGIGKGADPGDRDGSPTRTSVPAEERPDGDPGDGRKTPKRDKWREEDPERYKAYMKEFMRRKRAEARKKRGGK